MIELPLAVIDGVPAKMCVRSGFCCKQAPCGFGEWNEDETQCKHLKTGADGRYQCGIADEIVKDPTWVISPAFGAGCCSPLNSDRMRIIRDRRKNVGGT